MSNISRSHAYLIICLKWVLVKSVELICKVFRCLKIFNGTYLFIRRNAVKSNSSTSSHFQNIEIDSSLKIQVSVNTLWRRSIDSLT